MNSKELRDKGELIGAKALHIEDELDIQAAIWHTRALTHIKTLRTLLTDVTRYIEQEEEDRGHHVNASESQPCLLCNGHYKMPDEYVRGIRYEPVPGKGWVFLCWECIIALAKVINDQLQSLAYTFLFSHSPSTRELKSQMVPVETKESDM